MYSFIQVLCITYIDWPKSVDLGSLKMSSNDGIQSKLDAILGYVKNIENKLTESREEVRQIVKEEVRPIVKEEVGKAVADFQEKFKEEVKNGVAVFAAELQQQANGLDGDLETLQEQYCELRLR